MNNDKKYSPNKAYGDANLANILFAKELDRRYRSDGIAAVAFHPGNVRTNFASDTTSMMRFVYQTPILRNFSGLISPEKGAEPLLWLADGTPRIDWISGGYYEKNKIAKTNPQAADAQLAADLWDKSADMVGLSAPSH